MASTETVLPIVLYTAGAGASIPIGGLIAHVQRIRPRWLEKELRHAIL